ncbi:MAG: thymidine phosphorylase [Paracoccaceae bacterium]|nr:thymidine phosphorylase [Paracoccaceae bacterium]
MLPQEIIRKKRDGNTLTSEEIAEFVAGLTSGATSDAQAAAFAMAVLLKKMSLEERVVLTKAMRDSGQVMRWDLPGPVVDKHSTGGVGDNVSLMLAPALAACGVYVPMISGRGLGHTGGTLDKFDSIPGYQTQPDAEKFSKVVADVGCAIIGQTADLAPADKKLYAIRDVTGTVESVDLITASILSKKLASGLDALILDVKCGNGAFMPTPDTADELARSLVQVANGAGCKTAALLTDMNEPLAAAAGNAVEVWNACAFLTGHEVDPRLWDVTVALGGEALTLAGATPDAEIGRMKISESFESGAAAERFGRMVEALGGPTDFMESFDNYLPKAQIILDVEATGEGFATAIDTRGIGVAVVEIGGGRRDAADAIDHSVGYDQLIGLGAMVEAGDVIGRVHAADENAEEHAAAALRGAIRLSPDAPSPPDPVLGRIDL